MKWTRPSGSEIETNNEKATIEACEKMGWKESKPKKEAKSKKEDK